MKLTRKHVVCITRSLSLPVLDPNGRYESGSTDFRALVFGVTVGYRFH
jgi:hypothetical protein